MGESRQIKEARRRLAGIAKQIDAEKRAKFRYPLWRLIAGIFLPRVKKDYLNKKRLRAIVTATASDPSSNLSYGASSHPAACFFGVGCLNPSPFCKTGN